MNRTRRGAVPVQVSWRALGAAIGCALLSPATRAQEREASPPQDAGASAPADTAEPVPPAPRTWGTDPDRPAKTDNQPVDGETRAGGAGLPAPAGTPPGARVAAEASTPTPPPSRARRPPQVIDSDAIPLRYTLEQIEVRGNTKTRSRVVLRYVPFRPGDVLDVDDPKVELTRYRLLGTGFFRDVQFSLKKGSRPGRVVLVIDVVERNTLVINDIWMGLGADADTRGDTRPLTAYAGLDVAETNLAGSGITLGTAVGIAQDQLALRLRFLHPAFLGTSWMTNATLLYNDAQDYFGNSDVNFVAPKVGAVGGRAPKFAIVQYERLGGTLGLGRDLSVSTQLWANYRLESIDAKAIPIAASHIRGTRGEADREPIDFKLLPDQSVLSTLSVTLQHDTRDRPILPTRGWFAQITGDVSLAPFGSEYQYTRIDVRASHWWPLSWGHVLRLELFGGAIGGDAPFFEQYYMADLSDFRASRVLGLNVERRPPPNFLNTSIVEIKRGDYAAKVDGEYRIPLYRGSRSVYGIDFFTSVGLFGLTSKRDLSDPPGGYSGASRIPIDLTANLGFRMDTSAGGFTFAFANVLGFIPVRNGAR